MDAQELLNRLQSRKQAILVSLPPNLQSEYEELQTVIRYVKRAINAIPPTNGAISQNDHSHAPEDEAKLGECCCEADSDSPPS